MEHSVPINFENQSYVAKSRIYFLNGDNRGGVILAKKALEENYSCQEAWDILYSFFGKGQPFEDFKHEKTRQFFPDKAIPFDAPITFQSSDLGRSQKQDIPPTIKELSINPTFNSKIPEFQPIPRESSVNLEERAPRRITPVSPSILADSAENEVSVTEAKVTRNGSGKDVMSAILFMPYAGAHAIPIIVVGEILLYFLFLGASGTSGFGGALIGIIVGVIVLLIASFAVPFIGYLFYFFIMVMIFLSGIVGGIFGLILGLGCGLGYFLTRWSTTTVSSVICALTGGITGFFVGSVSNFYLLSTFVSESSAWVVINYIIFIAMGMGAGILFVGIAEGTSLGESMKERTLQESASDSKFKSPLSFYIKTANLFQGFAKEGEKYS